MAKGDLVFYCREKNEALTRPRSFGVGENQGRAPKGFDFQSQDAKTVPWSQAASLTEAPSRHQVPGARSGDQRTKDKITEQQ